MSLDIEHSYIQRGNIFLCYCLYLLACDSSLHLPIFFPLKQCNFHLFFRLICRHRNESCNPTWNTATCVMWVYTLVIHKLRVLNSKMICETVTFLSEKNCDAYVEHILMWAKIYTSLSIVHSDFWFWLEKCPIYLGLRNFFIECISWCQSYWPRGGRSITLSSTAGTYKYMVWCR